jgi:hypothetical protein
MAVPPATNLDNVMDVIVAPVDQVAALAAAQATATASYEHAEAVSQQATMNAALQYP